MALASMEASAVRLSNTAHNVANLNTPGATRLATDVRSGATGAPVASTRPTDAPVDLAQELVEQRAAVLQYDVSARVVRSLQETQEGVVDLLA